MKYKARVISVDGFYTVIANEPIESGEVIFPLSGKIVKQPTKYSIQISKNEHLLLHSNDPNDLDSMWEFMNHSCGPNAYCDIEKMCVVAKKQINANEEIRFNYNTTEYEMASPFACKCKTANCYQEICGYKFLSEEQRKNLTYIAPHIKQLMRLIAQ